jgi:alkylhydroperoxidase family enzyme
VGSHARFLQLQGQNEKDVDAIARGTADKSAITAKERVLLEYVKVLTLEPAKVRDTHTEALRKAGWNDEQIFEASFITALFAFFNRMADAYGLDYPPNGWMPEELKPAAVQAPANPKP